MVTQSTNFVLNALDWLRLHLRITALEQSGPRLIYRFEFPYDDEHLTCDIYYVDDEANPMEGVSQEERLEMYEGRIALGMDVIRRSLQLARLQYSFAWNPRISFVLHEDCGMGGAVVHRVTKSFKWPEP